MTNVPTSTCQCPACISGTIHDSDCAVHNAPAYPNGECNCTINDKGLRMSNVQEALKQLIEFVEQMAVFTPHDYDQEGIDIVNTGKAALAEIDKCEPVAWMHKDIKSGLFEKPKASPEQFIPLFTSPQTRDWVWLSVAQINSLRSKEPTTNIFDFIKLVQYTCRQNNTKG